VLSYVKSRCPDAESGNRTVISPRELDIYVPSKKFAVECHGLYWHSEGSPNGANKHLCQEKKEAAHEKSVRLLQLFEDEWRDKRLIVESLIDHRLGMSNHRVFARKCTITSLTSKQQREFFDASHLAGYVPASTCIALVHKGVTVAALSLRKPRQAKHADELEVARFATTPGTNVIGGLSRLMNTVNEPVMTYVDKRLGDGNGYVSAGFKLVGSTGPDYWYTDNVCRYDRFKYRASESKTEKDLAVESGVSRIWGCGSWIMKRAV
jgi:hypothetical protein